MTINGIVLSEYLYYILGFSTGVSPGTLQQKGKIKDALENESKIIRTLKNFNFIPANETILIDAPGLMPIYNLLPNDAIILATCKLRETKLASHDLDFIVPCKSGAFQIVAGWWRHQPGHRTVGGVLTAHSQAALTTIWNAPCKSENIELLRSFHS